MYARVVTFNLNTEAWDEALAMVATIEEQIGDFSGLKSWVNITNRESGKGIAVAVFDSQESMEAVTDQVNELLAGFGKFFTAPPNVDHGEVIAYIDNN
jgi:hypothetical protein